MATQTVTLEQVLAKYTAKYQGWIIDSLAPTPGAQPGNQGTVVITLLSPGGDHPTYRKTILIANVQVSDFSEGT